VRLQLFRKFEESCFWDKKKGGNAVAGLTKKQDEAPRNPPREMAAEELKADRLELGYSQRELADILLTPRRTFEDWEAGRSRIPGVVRAALYYYRQYQPVADELMTYRMREHIDRAFPNGIKSAPVGHEEE